MTPPQYRRVLVVINSDVVTPDIRVVELRQAGREAARWERAKGVELVAMSVMLDAQEGTMFELWGYIGEIPMPIVGDGVLTFEFS